MKVLIFGATGLIGEECVRQAIEDKEIERVTAIARRPLDPKLVSDKLNVIIHLDFLDYAPLLTTFEEHQGCIWALGVSQRTVKEAEYIKITHDYTLAAAQAMAQVNGDMRFVFVSGTGADPSEQSRILFGRIKGKTENDLVKDSNLKDIYTVRPAAVLSAHMPASKVWYERALMPAMHVLKIVKPSWVISSTSLARAILYLIKHGHHATLFENQDLRDLVSEHHLVE
jgi:nucleoside-diphosphate-sugar epimerase